ncbi:MAG: 30S ribosomal protein S4 [Patescibacteria group bacterium]|nr:30S ribosomal protein S4 [Patescibacteria group bacterium]MDE2144645.1 30S ribosomal protein S4 [Patescibacteria group bacterium]
MKPVLEKRERSLGTKLSIKGERCNSPKCALVRKPNPPGSRSRKRFRKPKEFGLQMKEKQKMRFIYGLRDSQLRAVFIEAVREGRAGANGVLSLLERRIDNVVFRMGLAASRSISRKLVSHGHFLVNGRRVTSPALILRQGDVIKVRPESAGNKYFTGIAEKLKGYEFPVWIKLDLGSLSGELVGEPGDIELPVDIGAVVDYYSK